MSTEKERTTNWVADMQKTALEIANKTKEGLMTFDDAIKEIENIDLSGMKLPGDSLQLRLSLIFFSPGDEEKMTLASFFGEDCLIGKNKIDQYTVSRALWELWLAKKEVEHLTEVVDRQKEMLDNSGYFDPEGEGE